jgi:hypothetical protein
LWWTANNHYWTSTVNQYTLLAPTIDIVSIGAGGGSIATVDLGRLRVGPQSAGADPGPVCYGRGGVQPTVTDADVALGYIDPDYFLGGEFKLDRSLATKAIEEKIARPLNMSVRDAASGIIEIANHHMSDLIRKMTIERGYDPREFVVYGFGGAGPLHGGAFGRELGVKEVIFPLGRRVRLLSSRTGGIGDTPPTLLCAVRQRTVWRALQLTVRREPHCRWRERSSIVPAGCITLQRPGTSVDAPVARQVTATLDSVIEFEWRYGTFRRGLCFRQAGTSSNLQWSARRAYRMPIMKKQRV